MSSTRSAIGCRRRPQQAGKVNNAAALACLGSAEGRARVLRALTSRDDDEVQIAEVYLRHRPITDVGELRIVASGITRMRGSGAQVRALDTLARHRLSDRQSLDELARLFPARRPSTCSGPSPRSSSAPTIG